jgi:homoserine kinase type II
MALITPLSPSEASVLSSEYGIELAALEPLEAGSVNSNFRLTDARGRRFFARVYEEQGTAGAEAELRMLATLAAAEVPVAVPLARVEGGFLGRHGDKPFAVFPWVDGELYCRARVTPDVCRLLGDALARVHLATDRLGALPKGRFRVPDLRARLERVDREAKGRFSEATARIRERLDHYERARNADLPRGLVHGDLFRDNVLWQNDAIVALLDFESASEECFAYDVMVCVLAWCFGDGFELDRAGALLAGYHARRPLSAAERAALPIEGAIAALRFAVTRITDFSLRAAPGEPPVRDYRRFLARLDELEALRLEPVIRALLH